MHRLTWGKKGLSSTPAPKFHRTWYMRTSSRLQLSIWTTQRDRSMELLEKAGLQHALCQDMPVEMAPSVTQTSHAWASLWRVDDTLAEPAWVWCIFHLFCDAICLPSPWGNSCRGLKTMAVTCGFFFFLADENMSEKAALHVLGDGGWGQGGGEGWDKKAGGYRPWFWCLPIFLISKSSAWHTDILKYCFLKPSNLWVGRLVMFLSYYSAKSAPSWDEENHQGISGQLNVEWYI